MKIKLKIKDDYKKNMAIKMMMTDEDGDNNDNEDDHDDGIKI